MGAASWLRAACPDAEVRTFYLETGGVPSRKQNCTGCIAIHSSSSPCLTLSGSARTDAAMRERR